MSPVHPELEGPLKRMSAVDPTKRIFRFLGRQGPTLMCTPRISGVSVESVRDGNVQARIYRPTGVPTRSGASLPCSPGGCH